MATKRPQENSAAATVSNYRASERERRARRVSGFSGSDCCPGPIKRKPSIEFAVTVVDSNKGCARSFVVLDSFEDPVGGNRS
jgi:hypothetical protein